MKYFRWTASLALLATLAWLTIEMPRESSVQAQSGSRYSQQGSSSQSRGRTSPRGRTTRGTVASYESKLWDWLHRVEYHNWAPGPGQSTDVYPGQSPHGAYLKTYLNRTAAGNASTLPHGSIIVKENFGPDGKTLMAVTVMYRAKDYNPAANDWYWVKYTADGNVAMTPPEKGNMPISGKFASCIECHSSAEGNDFSFIND
ncbi:MAG: cytochrome P460 family protein [Planctomycetaceae bacterium]|nr:cytochrome P460 family protein [Planctomycetaceae bacterium]